MKRNFIVKCIPAITLEMFQPTLIKIGYLTSNPIESGIKEVNNKYYYFAKKNENQKVEKEISKDDFNKLKDEFKIFIINKTSYQIPLSAKLVIELNVYHDYLHGLKTATIDFSDIVGAENFSVPNWFGDEITFDSDFKEYNLNKTFESVSKMKINKKD